MENATRTVPAGNGVLGRVINGVGQPLDGKGTLEGAIQVGVSEKPALSEQTSTANAILETGLKVVDLLAPLSKSAVLGLFSEPGLGKLVLAGELVYRMARQHNAVLIFAGLPERTFAPGEVMNGWRELGIDDRTVVIFGEPDTGPKDARQVLLTALALAEDFQSRAGRSAILYIDSKLGETGNLADLQARLKASALLTFLAEPSNPVPGATLAGIRPDANFVFDKKLAEQKLYPALDRTCCGSDSLQPETAELQHIEIAGQVRDYLRRYNALATKAGTSQNQQDLLLLARGRRLQLFLTQPLFVAEAYTGLPGEYVPLAATIQGCQEILAGRYDDLPEEAFNFAGALEDVLEKAAARP